MDLLFETAKVAAVIACWEILRLLLRHIENYSRLRDNEDRRLKIAECDAIQPDTPEDDHE